MASGGRTFKRRHLIYYLEVYNAETAALIGHLVDITEKGLKIVSKEPVLTDKVMRLKMKLPEGYFERPDVDFTVRSLWCNNDVNPDFFDTGFILVRELEEEDVKTIHNLIDTIGFSDFTNEE